MLLIVCYSILQPRCATEVDDKVGEILSCLSGSKGCDQLYKVQLAAGYLLHARGFETSANTVYFIY